MLLMIQWQRLSSYLKEPFASLFKNSFEAESCIRRSRHNSPDFFVGLSDFWLNHQLFNSEYQIFCEPISCMLWLNFQNKIPWPGNCKWARRLWESGFFLVHLPKSYEHFRRMPKQRGFTEDVRWRMRTSLVSNSHKEEGKFSCQNGRFGQ